MKDWLAHPHWLSKAEWIVVDNFGAALFAFVAAVLWFISAYGKLPRMGSYWDYVPETDPFYRAVKFSAIMNRWAAVFAGVSALFAAFVAYLSLP